MRGSRSCARRRGRAVSPGASCHTPEVKSARGVVSVVVSAAALAAFVMGRWVLGMLLDVIALVLWPDKESLPGIGN
jgi:hypothetical protein